MLEQYEHNPLTVSRVLRLVLAALDDTADTQTAAMPVLEDVGGCAVCLSMMVCVMTGWVAAAMTMDRLTVDEAVDGTRAKLTMLLDELASQG